ncbi:late embryogenesis abundant protein 18-like [Camellia sinensis]|uniref:late embryogenesis abundant protein 18-like n=1 Tax=Camellia sinensis TaxID=4442 RepID=UPI0010358C1E|nr:late embryogenesis abundant protein 18-like [Camellia sinensis]
MHSAKEKVSNVVSEAKGKLDETKAKAEEKVEKATARTTEEERMAEEKRRAKEGEAKMGLHEAKAEHAADKLQSGHHHPVGTAAPMAGATAPTYPPGGNPPGHHKYT